MAGPKPMRAAPMKTKKLVRNVKIERAIPGRKSAPTPKPAFPKKTQPVIKAPGAGKKAS